MKISIIKHLMGVAMSFCVAVPVSAQMAMPGGFSVSPSGAATYTIPIQVPPGISGVEPAVSLNYNSQAGNGLLGVGWSLSAGSVISRCPQNKAQDGAIKGVSLTLDDRFCLDGQRLVVVNGGTYGAAGSEYRTEIDSFSQIIANGTSGNGPASFTVKTKSGQVMEYGGSADSKIEAGPNVATLRSWALSKTADRLGNTILYTYEKDNANVSFNGSFYLTSIAYGGNEAKGLVTGANNLISFNYAKTRSDARTGYSNGYAVAMRGLLKNIVTSSGGNQIFEYTLNYETGPGTWRNRMKSVVQCGAGGVCYPATVMQFPVETTSSLNVVADYQPPRPTMRAHSADGSTVVPFAKPTSFYSGEGLSVVSRSSASTDSCLVTCGKWYTLDATGDGRVDLVHMTTNPYDTRIWRSAGDGTFSVTKFLNDKDRDLQNGSWQVMDLNGDGLYDMVHITTNPGNMILWISNGDGTFKVSSIVKTNDTNLMNGSWQVLDVNGDGLADLIHITTNPGGIIVWKSTGTGDFDITVPPASTADINLAAGLWYPMDVNGDGLTDLVHLNHRGSLSYVWVSKGDGTFSVSNFVIENMATDPVSDNFGYDLSRIDPFQLMDVNGDGLLDLVQMTSTSGRVHVFQSMGNGRFYYSSFINTVDLNIKNGLWRSIDFNGDGLVDLFHVADDTGKFYLWMSSGDGTFSIFSGTGPGTGLLTKGSLMMGDFRGDGFVDLTHLKSDTGEYVSWGLYRVFMDVATSITNGVNGSVDWTTAPLPWILNKGDGTSEGAYSMEPRAGRPNMTTTTISPMRVVTTSAADDGIGGQRKFIYSYGSARNDAIRGYLGFGWTQQVEKSTGLVRRTNFLQNFPYVGSIDTVGTGTSVANWSNLTSQKYSYGCFLTTDKSLCTSANIVPGKRYFPYVGQIDSQAWDLDGTALPRVRIANKDPDLYGNFWKITNETLDAAGNKTDFSKTIVNKYAAPDTSRWIVDRLLTRTVTTSGPTVPTPVVPGAGALASAPAPVLPTSVLIPIISYLLDDN